MSNIDTTDPVAISEIQIHFTNGSRMFIVRDYATGRFCHYDTLLPTNSREAAHIVDRLAAGLRPQYRPFLDKVLTQPIAEAIAETSQR